MWFCTLECTFSKPFVLTCLVGRWGVVVWLTNVADLSPSAQVDVALSSYRAAKLHCVFVAVLLCWWLLVEPFSSIGPLSSRKPCAQVSCMIT